MNIDPVTLPLIAERILREVFHNMIPKEPAVDRIIQIICDENKVRCISYNKNDTENKALQVKVGRVKLAI